MPRSEAEPDKADQTVAMPVKRGPKMGEILFNFKDMLPKFDIILLPKFDIILFIVSLQNMNNLPDFVGLVTFVLAIGFFEEE